MPTLALYHSPGLGSWLQHAILKKSLLSVVSGLSTGWYMGRRRFGGAWENALPTTQNGKTVSVRLAADNTGGASSECFHRGFDCCPSVP